jgi:hypothetical protein
MLVNSRTIRPNVTPVPNQGATGKKGIWATETKGRALSFRSGLGLPGLCTPGPPGLALARGQVLLARYRM